MIAAPVPVRVGLAAAPEGTLSDELVNMRPTPDERRTVPRKRGEEAVDALLKRHLLASLFSTAQPPPTVLKVDWYGGDAVKGLGLKNGRSKSMNDAPYATMKLPPDASLKASLSLETNPSLRAAPTTSYWPTTWWKPWPTTAEPASRQ